MTTPPRAVDVAGIDHIGLTVASLAHGIEELSSILDGGLCYLEGPITQASGGWMERKLGVPGDSRLQVAAMSVMGQNLELFEYRQVDDRLTRPKAGTPGSFHIHVRTPTPEHLIRRMAENGIVTTDTDGKDNHHDAQLNCGINLSLELASNTPQLFGAVHLEPCGHKTAIRDLVEVFGMRIIDQVDAFGNTGPLLRSPKGGAALAVLQSTLAHGPMPKNHQVGGHHVAFHANDVDGAVRELTQDGKYQAMGEPETITDGPIAGDRWVYVRSPFGLQLEIINMPDGAMPYESDATYLRTPIHS